MVILVHVDDCTIIAATTPLIYAFKAQISRHVEITDQGELHWLLGIEIKEIERLIPSDYPNVPISFQFSITTTWTMLSPSQFQWTHQLIYLQPKHLLPLMNMQKWSTYRTMKLLDP